VLGNRDLSRVVQQRRGFDCLEHQFISEADFARKAQRTDLHAADVPVGDLVLRVDRGRERFHCRQIHAIELIDVALRVFQAPERRSHREVGDEEQRQNQRDDAEMHLLKRDDEQQRYRRASGIRRRERQEVLAPHFHRAASRFRGDDRRRQAAVDEEVRRRQHTEREDESRRRRRGRAERRHAGGEEEHRAGCPNRQGQVADIENGEGNAVLAAKREKQRVDRDGH
jgi:hypothetical protein